MNRDKSTRLPANEPKSAEAVLQWVETRTRANDRFAHVAAKYDSHRAAHGCYDVYPYSNGALLGTLAAAHRARRIVEVGGGLGYSALWFAYGAGPGSLIESVERDPTHAAIAREHFTAAGLSDRVKILEGIGAKILPALNGELRSHLLRHRPRRIVARSPTVPTTLEARRLVDLGEFISRPTCARSTRFGKNRRVPRANFA